MRMYMGLSLQTVASYFGKVSLALLGYVEGMARRANLAETAYEGGLSFEGEHLVWKEL